MTPKIQYGYGNEDIFASRSARLRSKPMPLAFGEVAEMPKPLRRLLWDIAKLPVLVLGLSAIVLALGALVG